LHRGAERVREVKRGAEKPTITMKAGEIVVARRLYRSGQSEYLINGRVARLRDIQEIFMGIGLGPDSYAIIEQGRIGQILNSKPMDRRAIIEEAAGSRCTRRSGAFRSEAGSVEAQSLAGERHFGGSGKAAGVAEAASLQGAALRGIARADARAAADHAASKAAHLDIEAARLQTLLRDMDAAEEREARTLHGLEAEQERLNARTYELDAELRQTQNLLGQTALDLDRSENRITFNREQAAQLESRAMHLAWKSAGRTRHGVN
jgi:chromosome segregation protein